MKKIITIITPCFNEQDNIDDVYREIKSVFDDLSEYGYEHLFIDNASTDNTVDLLRKIATSDSNVKVIVNAKNLSLIHI